jgi:IS5 family transposase
MKGKFNKKPQLDFIGISENNPENQKYQGIHAVLIQCPDILDAILRDITGGVEYKKPGRKGMTAEQVLRFLIVMQIENFDYRKLPYKVEDSRILRWFCKLENNPSPKHSALNENIKKITPETLENINKLLVQFAVADAIETGETIRIDTTAVESNIHYPTDNTLLCDCVRVATRLAEKACEDILGKDYYFPNRKGTVSKRNLEILNARGRYASENRQKSYKILLNFAEEIYLEMEDLGRALMKAPVASLEQYAKLAEFQKEIGELLPKFDRVLTQTERRVLKGEKVPALEKIFSIFEAHTNIIEKGLREAIFGHKICLTTGRSNLVLDCVLELGNPNDTTFFPPVIDRHIELFGAAPKKTASDGGFHSAANLAYAKAAGVDDVFFSKGAKKKLTEYVKSTWIYKQLRRFRNGVEACISWLKRCFGLERCTWKGWESFQSYVWSGVIAYNLNILASYQTT